MAWIDHILDPWLAIFTRKALQKAATGDARLAAAILKSCQEKPWLERHIPVRTREELQRVTNHAR